MTLYLRAASALCLLSITHSGFLVDGLMIRAQLNENANGLGEMNMNDINNDTDNISGPMKKNLRPSVGPSVSVNKLATTGSIALLVNAASAALVPAPEARVHSAAWDNDVRGPFFKLDGKHNLLDDSIKYGISRPKGSSNMLPCLAEYCVDVKNNWVDGKDKSAVCYYKVMTDGPHFVEELKSKQDGPHFPEDVPEYLSKRDDVPGCEEVSCIWWKSRHTERDLKNDEYYQKYVKPQCSKLPLY